MIALHFVALDLAKQIENVLILDTFGNRFQPQAVRHLDDRPHDRRVFRIHGHITHEGLVDLELVDLEPLQVREAGVAGSEIVDRQLDAHLLEPLDG